MSRSISEAIKNHSTKTADLNKRIVKRYLGGGIWLVKKLGCNKIGIASAGQGSASYAPGMSVTISQTQGSNDQSIISLPPPARRGSSALPVSTLGSGTLDALAVTSAAPSVAPRGSVGLVVALAGSGFSASPVDLARSVIFDVFSRSWILDPYVEVTGVTFVSETELDIIINVFIDCPIGYKPKFEIRRG